MGGAGSQKKLKIKRREPSVAAGLSGRGRIPAFFCCADVRAQYIFG
jgi:hypothetical protein